MPARSFGLAACAALLAACTAPEGDFGRPAPGIVQKDILPVAGFAVARWREEPVSGFNLTDDEVQLRTLAYTAVQPMRASQKEERLFAEFRFARLHPLGSGQGDIRSYYEALRSEPFASSEARFSALVLDVRTDEDRLTPFVSLARKIVMADEERYAAARRLPDLGAGELADIDARVAENRDVIMWVRSSLLLRIEAYRYALGRLAIETPSVRVRAGEVALQSLEARLANPLGLIVSSRSVRHGGGGVYEYSAPYPGSSGGAIISK